MTLWIDVEDIYAYMHRNSRPSGIQRLCFELYTALLAVPDLDVRFLHHDSLLNTLRVVEWTEVANLYQEMTRRIAVSPSPPAPDSSHTLGTGSARHLITRLPPELREALGHTVRSQMIAARAAMRAVRALPTLWYRPSHASKRPASTGIDIMDLAKPGDVLGTFGSPWAHPAYAGMVSRIVQARDMRFALLIYDLIPAIRPEFCDRGLVDRFLIFLRDCLPAADHILTISRTTADDVTRWAGHEEIALRCAPKVIPIGNGFATSPPSALPAGLSPSSYALFVSTIEARKNHMQVFRIWRRMLEEMPREQVPTLVFAGRVGWMVADLMQAIENTNWLDGKLVLVREPDDATLSALYRSCRFTLFPSHYEGWGLPVSESLSFGKVCIASNSTAVPEAGGNLCLYVDPDNTSGAYEVVRNAIQQPEVIAELEARIADSYRPVSWSDTAAALLDAIT